MTICNTLAFLLLLYGSECWTIEAKGRIIITVSDTKLWDEQQNTLGWTVKEIKILKELETEPIF